MNPLFAHICRSWQFILGLLWLMGANAALADTPLALKQSWAGNVNYVGTQKTLRTSPNTGNPCNWVGAGSTTSAALTGIPASATIKAAYLYWAGSGATPDYAVTFEGTAYTATSQYTSDSVGYRFFSGVVDVTSKVVAKRNGTYGLSNLTIDNTDSQDNYCSVQAVLGGWALVVIYSDASEPLRVINLYEGFQYYQNDSITLTLSNFKTPTPLGTATGKASHISWEGDPTLSGGGEDLKFQGIALSDANNPSGNQFNSISNIAAVAPSTGAVDSAAYGVDFDAYVLNSTHLTAGMTSASTVYSSGGDLVLLSAEVIAVPNVPVADLGIAMGFSGTMGGGQTVTYTLNVTNNGPNDETGPITVTNTPPAGLTYTGASGSGWVCNAPYTSCTRAGTLASGAAASPITLTATVSASASGTITNTASVAGQLFDNVPGNNTVSDSRTALAADLSLTMTGGALVPGSNATYTLTVTNNGPDTHTGTITLADTLPAGLSYVLASGTGWTCNSGVTCTYAASLASGAAAPAVTLTVAVASGATSITNSATVTAAYYDGTAGNNTASLSWGGGATGGCTSGSVGGDTLITCTSNGTLTLPANVTSVRYLIVGGGGGGGGINNGNQDGAGGGGAGGVLAGAAFTVSPGTTYSVVVGSGGTAGTGAANGGNGGNSTFSTLTASGGGGGAREGGYDGLAGGSGGGGSDNNVGGAGTAGQGNAGGNGNNNDAGGGGGGAGAAGQNGGADNGGNGGNGVSDDITGSATYYGGGGGGGADDNATGGAGGQGGGGAGSIGRGAGTPGTANTGGGGGGATGSNGGTAASGGVGGSGIVIIRYAPPGTVTQSCEGFESGLGGWAVDNSGGTDPDYGTAVIDTAHAQSGSQSLLMSRDWVRVTMNDTLNTTTATGSISFGYGRGLGGDYPEAGDNLQVEYFNSSGTWSTLTTITGTTASDPGFLTYSAVLPAAAKHSGFKLRLTQLAGSGSATNNYDQWNIDNVCIPISTAIVDHYELSVPSASVACAASPVTVTACSDNTSPCTSKATTIGGSTATLAASAGSLGSTTVTFDATGTASTTLSHAAAADGAVVTVTLSGESSVATNPRQCCPDGVGCTVADTCSTTFNTAGFIFSATADGGTATIPTQTAGTGSSTYYLRAVKTSTTTKACEAALSGTTSVNLAFQCADPTTCSSGGPSCGSGSGYLCLTPYNGVTPQTAQPIAANPATGVSSYSAVSLIFDSNGSAPFTFDYRDVGSISLHALKAASGTLLTSLSGATNAFVVKPYALVLSGIKCTTADAANCGAGALAMPTAGDNPAAADAAGVTFIRAGDPFSVTVTAQANGGGATPNFGKESTAEWVKLTPTLVTGLGLTANPSVDRTTTGSISNGSSTLTVATSAGYAAGDRIRIAGAGAAGADLITTVSSVASATVLNLSAAAATTVPPPGAEVHYMFPAFSGGMATGSNFTWGEVGIVTLTPSLGDGSYLGAGSVAGTVSSNVGRFYPHHFGVTGSVVNRSDLATPGGSFTYMGEPMKLTLEVAAYNKFEGLTQNYSGDFAKLRAAGTPSLGTTRANWVCTSGSQCMGLAAVSGSDLTSRFDIDLASTNSADPTNTTTSGGATVGWAAGKSYFTLFGVFNRAATPDGPYTTLKFGAKPLDSDGVTLPPKGSLDISHCSDLDVTAGSENAACTFTAAEAQLRRKVFDTAAYFGRLRLSNAYGAASLPLPLPAEVQYYDSTTGLWLTNGPDGGSTSPWSLSPAGSTALAGDNHSGNATLALGGSVASGIASLTATAAASSAYGYLDATVNVPAYLRWPWRGCTNETGFPANCTGAEFISPSARASFGLYRGNNRLIYRRERYGAP